MRIYFYSVPKKIGPTQHERLRQRIKQMKLNDINMEIVIMDGDNEIGYLEGSKDDLRLVTKYLFKEYNVKKFDTIEQFYGACYYVFGDSQVAYNHLPDEEKITITIEDFMSDNGFTDFDTNLKLEYLKAYKIFLLKEDIRNQLMDSDDSLADIFKVFLAKTIWYDSMSSEQKTDVDNAINTIKNVYSMDSCINAVLRMADNANKVNEYYNNKQSLDSLTTYDEIKNF